MKYIYSSFTLFVFVLLAVQLSAQTSDTLKISKKIWIVRTDNGDQLIKSDGSIISTGIEEEGVKISFKNEWDKRYTVYHVEGNGWQGYGFLHYDGVVVTKPVFEKIIDSEWNIDGVYDYAIVWYKGKAGVYEKNYDPDKSKLIIDNKLDTIEITYGGYADIRFKVLLNGLWGLANTDGKLTIPIDWEDIIYNYYNRQSLIKEFDKWGIYDERKGVVMIPWLDQVIIGDGLENKKSNGIIVAESFGAWGAYNWDGEQLGEMEYDSFVKFLPYQSLWKNAAIFSKKGKLYRVNLSGDVEKYKEK